MEATAVKGIWVEKICDGYDLVIDTNHNVITVNTPFDKYLTHKIPGGITINDLMLVKNEVIKTFKLQNNEKSNAQINIDTQFQRNQGA